MPRWIGPDGGVIVALAVDPLNSMNVYAGSWGGGVYKSTDGGNYWFRSSDGLGSLVVNALGIDPQNPDVVYAGTYKGKMYKSVDGGKNWVFSSQGIQEEAIVYSIVVDPVNTNVVYIATRGISTNTDRPWNGVVYKSSDGGASWSPSLYNLGGSSYQDWVYALTIHPDQHEVLFAATHEHGPMRSTNSGRTWQIITDGITNFSTRAIGVQPGTSPGVVYTGVWTKDGVFKSSDGGDTWQLKSSGLSGANIYGMSIDPQSPRTIYLAAYNMGVMKTTSGGNTWFNAGLPSSPVGVVAVNPGNHDVVFAGTSGEGCTPAATRARPGSPARPGSRPARRWGWRLTLRMPVRFMPGRTAAAWPAPRMAAGPGRITPAAWGIVTSIASSASPAAGFCTPSPTITACTAAIWTAPAAGRRQAPTCRMPRCQKAPPRPGMT